MSGRARFNECRNCRDNLCHERFIPVLEFTKDHLPPEYQSEDVMTWIQKQINLTGRVRIKYISKNRPDTFPECDVKFSYIDFKGMNMPRGGTGCLDDKLEGERVKRLCPCPECKIEPKIEYWKFQIVTTNYLVYDKSEAETLVFEIFFDSEERKDVQRLYGIDVLGDERDRYTTQTSRVICVTHDPGIAATLNDVISRDVSSNRLSTNLGVMVSHPHGVSKMISMGRFMYTYCISMRPDTSVALRKGCTYRIPVSNSQEGRGNGDSHGVVKDVTEPVNASQSICYKSLQPADTANATECISLELCDSTLPFAMTAIPPPTAPFLWWGRCDSGDCPDLVEFPAGTKFVTKDGSNVNVPPNTEFECRGLVRPLTGLWMITYDIAGCLGSGGARLEVVGGGWGRWCHFGSSGMDDGYNCSTVNTDPMWIYNDDDTSSHLKMWECLRYVTEEKEGTQLPIPSEGNETSGYGADYKCGPEDDPEKCRMRCAIEPFLLASCQFVLHDTSDSTDESFNFKPPEDWSKVELVRRFSNECQKCPICLSPLSTGKITRCGHAFCSKCILKHIRESVGKQSCPFCKRKVKEDELKSLCIIPKPDFKVGDSIEMRLMCMGKGTILPKDEWNERQGKCMSFQETNNEYMKVVFAPQEQIQMYVIDMEREALTNALEDEEQDPNFIRKALERLDEEEQSLKKKLQQDRNRKENINLSDKAGTDVGDEARSSDRIEQTAPVEAATGRTDGIKDELGDCLNKDKAENETNDFCSSDSIKSNDVITDGQISPPLQIADRTVNPGPFQQHYSANELEVAETGLHADNVTKASSFFYMASTGQHVYLNSVTSQYLESVYGTLENCPSKIRGKILYLERFPMTEV